MLIQAITSQNIYNKYQTKNLSKETKQYHSSSSADMSYITNISFQGLYSPYAHRKGCEEFVEAAKNGDCETVERMIKNGWADSKHPYTGYSAQTIASKKGHDKIINCLMKDENFDPNEEDRNGYRGLAIAAENGQDHVAEMYLKHPKTNPNLGSRYYISKTEFLSRPAALFAAGNNDIYLLQALKEHPKFNPNITDESGITAMDIALVKDYKAFARELANDPRFDWHLVDEKHQEAARELQKNRKKTVNERKIELEQKEKIYNQKVKNLDKIIETKTEQIHKEEKAAAEKALEEARKKAEKEISKTKAALEKREEKLAKAETELKEKNEKLEKIISERVSQTLDKERIEQEKEISKTKAALEKREKNLTKAETELKEKNEKLEKIISERVSQTLDKERVEQEKELNKKRLQAENKIAQKEQELSNKESEFKQTKAKIEKNLEQRDNELTKAVEETENKSKALDTLINDYQQLLAEDVEYAKSGIRALYGIKIKNLPEKMSFGEQLLYVTDVLNSSREKLTDVNDNTPENITYAIQNDNKQITNEGLQFVKRLLQISGRMFKEEDLIDAIKSVKSNNGFNTEKITYFLAKAAWNDNTIRNIISQVKKLG